MGAYVYGGEKTKKGGPRKKDRPRFLLLRELLKQPDDLLRLHPVRSFPEHPLGVNLLPVNPERGQLGRERLAGLPIGEGGDDSPRGAMDQGVAETTGLAHPPAVAAEDPDQEIGAADKQ